jgi:starch synthase
MSRLAILFATAEMAPWVKTGGLGDVAAACPPPCTGPGTTFASDTGLPGHAQGFSQATRLAEIPPLAPGLPAARLLASESRRPAADIARLPGTVRPPRQSLP